MKKADLDVRDANHTMSHLLVFPPDSRPTFQEAMK